MTDRIENMKPYLGKRLVVQGVYHSHDSSWMEGIRYTGKVCIQYPEVDGKQLCDHMHIVNSDRHGWSPKEQGDIIGCRVEFTASVGSFWSNKRRANDYNFVNPTSPKILFRPTALKSARKEEEEMQIEVAKFQIAPLAPALPALALAPLAAPLALAPHPVPNPTDRIKQVKALVKACGGYDKTEEVVKLMGGTTMTTGELLEYIEAMKD